MMNFARWSASIPMPKTYAEIVADEIRASGYSVGIVGYIDGEGRDMWAADAWRENDGGHRYIAWADSELAAWIALKQTIFMMDEGSAKDRPGRE